jgi:DNA processing protein
MKCDAETAAWIELSLVPQLGAAAFRDLLKAFGLPSAILANRRTALARVVPDALAARIVQRGAAHADVERALLWLQQPGRSLITLADESYPRQLLEIGNPPPLLYVEGEPGLLARPALAIVGSRNATPQGKANAEDTARSLSRAVLPS